jgi:hypothetical protein
MKRKPVIILLHVLGCIGFLAIPVLFSPDLKNPELFHVPPFQRDFLSYVLLIGFFYFNYFILIPELYFRKQYVFFFISALACFFFIQLICHLIIPQHNPPPPPPGDHPHLQPRFLMDYAHNFSQFIAVFIFSMLLRISTRWKQVEKEKLNAELSYLKAQINPHFLFNTLNSIYSLAILRSDETPNAVVKLSDMMRYITTETQNEFVSLEKELAYVGNFIALQKIRLGNTVEVNYSVAGEMRDKKIAPLLLIPFVENAFKYGVNPEEPSAIIISILIRDKELTLHVINKKVNIDYSKGSKSGHGIENTKHRLQLCYPGRYKLRIDDTHAEYSVHLNITL